MNWYKQAQTNRYLYHATYKPLLDKIRQEGLNPPVFLAQDKYQAESFAEIAVDTEGSDKDIPEEWLDEIVILSVNSIDLDKNFLKVDPYFETEEASFITFEYGLNIPPEIIS